MAGYQQKIDNYSGISTASSFSYADLPTEYREYYRTIAGKEFGDPGNVNSRKQNTDPYMSCSEVSFWRPATACSSHSNLFIEEDCLRDPPSFYHIPEMNKRAVDQTPRRARQPSQYHLDTLAETYIFDIPRPKGRPAAEPEDDETALECSVPFSKPIDLLASPRGVISHYVDHDLE